MEEIADGFEPSQFGSAPTKFDVQDLFPLTARKLHGLPLEAVAEDVAAVGVPADKAALFWKVCRENITVRGDLAGWWTLFSEGAEPMVADEDKDFIAHAMSLLPEGPFDADTWGNWTKAVKEATGRKGKGLFMPLRKAMTGQERGPEMADVMQLLQKVPARALAQPQA